MFLTPEQTGEPLIFALRDGSYLAIGVRVCNTGYAIAIYPFDVRQLAKALGQSAGDTWQEHASLILLACMDGKLFEHLDLGGELCR